MKIIKWIKRKLNICFDCWKKAGYHFEYPPMNLEDTDLEVQYCFEHAKKSGFCLGCGGFFAGVESFDFSEVEGFCSDCIDEINYELGWDPYDEYGDADYYDDYAHSFDERQPAPSQSLTTKEEK